MTSSAPSPRSRRVAVVSAFALLAALAFAPAAADASSVVYRCGDNLCSVGPDGTGVRQLTADGSDGGGAYSQPTLSADGARLAFLRGGRDLYVADADAGNRSELADGFFHQFAAIRPDGAQVAAITVSYFPDFRTDLYVRASDGSGSEFAHRAPGSFGWLGDRLLTDNGAIVSGLDVCLWHVAERRCERTVADDPSRDIVGRVEASPDGSTLAASVAEAGGGYSIALFSTATGEHLKDLTGGANDGSPTWSPDGRRIAFERTDGNVYVIPVDGRPGDERLLTAGAEPSWGGPPDPPTSTGQTPGTGTPPGTNGPDGEEVDGTPPVLRLAVTKSRRLASVLRRGLRVTARCDEACDLSAVLILAPRAAKALGLARRRAVIGRGSAQLGAAGQTSLKVKITRKAKRRLKRARRVPATLRVTARDASGNTRSSSRKVSLVR